MTVLEVVITSVMVMGSQVFTEQPVWYVTTLQLITSNALIFCISCIISWLLKKNGKMVAMVTEYKIWSGFLYVTNCTIYSTFLQSFWSILLQLLWNGHPVKVLHKVLVSYVVTPLMYYIACHISTLWHILSIVLLLKNSYTVTGFIFLPFMHLS